MRYLTSEEIVKMNTIQIYTYSPKEIIGVKDINGLEMSVNQLSQSVFGVELYPKIEEKAAILMINIIKKHPFHNGNKRTAFMAMDVFLGLNGFETTFTEKIGIEIAVRIATTTNDNFDTLKDEVAGIIKVNIKPINK